MESCEKENTAPFGVTIDGENVGFEVGAKHRGDKKVPATHKAQALAAGPEYFPSEHPVQLDKVVAPVEAR